MISELVFDSSYGDHPGSALSDFEDDLAAAAGVRNAADGRLVTLTVKALSDDLWQGSGIHSPVQWLMWQTGVARVTARRVVTIAARASELPVTLGLLAQGRLSLDQAHAIARFTPAEYEESVSNLALNATVNQITSATRLYDFDIEKPKGGRPSGRSEHGMSFGFDDDGTWWARIRLAADEGAVVETALNKVRDALHDDARETAKKIARLEGRPDTGTDKELGVEAVSWTDAFTGMANSILNTGASGAVRAPRTGVHLHLEAPIHGEGAWVGELHGGTRLPDWLRRQLSCDANITTIWEREGVPLSTCRGHRTPPERLRRLIEHRDRYTCRAPGCDSTRWLQAHHIIHWEDDGPTTTDNLVCLCPRHHRMHHQGLLGISGNPDIPIGDPGGLEFTNEYGRVIPPVGTPRPPRPGEFPTVGPYSHPTGEHLRRSQVYFNKSGPSAAPPG
ncbi:MAG: DUF222 domain-containing protein [Microthrixaceae bacterium]|nr:DUF222 domain-containing protein [Microthrixaceae bacterium]